MKEYVCTYVYTYVCMFVSNGVYGWHAVGDHMQFFFGRYGMYARMYIRMYVCLYQMVCMDGMEIICSW